MKTKLKKIGLIIVAGLVLLIIFKFDLMQYSNLDSLKKNYSALLEIFNSNPTLSLSIYFVVYVLTTAFSIPGATVLTLAGGALFGLAAGTLVVSFASTLGASLAFLASRYILRDSIQKRFSKALDGINKGIEKEGAFYLLALRLIPIFPFFVINLAMGLTKIRLRNFFLVSQLGMLPGTLVYVNAGTNLAQIKSLSQIMSFNTLLSFSLLGIVPLISKKFIDFFRSKKIYKNFKRPKKFDYNVIVIGAGSGGLVSAYIAAITKAKVLLIEKNEMGGDCLNTGCVPSKALIHSAAIMQLIKESKKYGISRVDCDFNFKLMMEGVKNAIKKIQPHDSIERYESLGVEIKKGSANLTSPFSVKVGDELFTTKNIIIATGASPVIPNIPGRDEIHYVTSDTLWKLENLPRRFLIVGGGPIGLEIAQSFCRFGSKVTLVEMGEQIIGTEDPDVAAELKDNLLREGFEIKNKCKLERFIKNGDIQVAVIQSDSTREKIPFDTVLFAVGRKSTVQGFGLENLGIKLTHSKKIEVDEFQRTQFPNIFAVGDVSSELQFTHVASHQAWYASVNALFAPWSRFKTDNRIIPRCTFTDPQVARVGLNEKEARETHTAFESTVYHFSDLDRAIIDQSNRGFIKVLTKPGSDVILGVTIVSAHASELLSEWVLAMKHRLGLNKILGTIHSYPTFSEANKYVAGVWKKEHSPKKILQLMEKYHAWKRH